MLELCIDTSVSTAVAVVRDGLVLARQSHSSTRHHAESLSPMVRAVCRQAGLEGNLREAGFAQVLVGRGPGPFTGLRAGLVTAQVLAKAWKVPVYGVGSLEVIARSALDLLDSTTRVLAVSDAKRHEIYWGVYESQGPNDVSALVGPVVGPVSEIAPLLREYEALVTGPGADLVKNSLDVPIAQSQGIDPAILSRLVEVRRHQNPGQVESIEPLYLRRPDVHPGPSA